MRAKLFLTILFLMSISIGYSFPLNTGITYSKSDKLKETIEEGMAFPSNVKEQQLEGVVLVDFTITAGRKAQINAMNYSHYEFKDQVIKELNKINKEADPELIGKTFIYKFVFIRK